LQRRIDGGLLSSIKAASWSQLNSLTQTGYQQIGARLSAAGIGSNFHESQVVDSLNWADALGVLVVGGFASIAKNEQQALAALERARSVASL
jgi:hypothetical protein